MIDPRKAIAHALADVEGFPEKEHWALADDILLALANEGCDPEDQISRDEQAELYEVYRMAQRRTCNCDVCTRLRQKRWSDQNNLIPGERWAQQQELAWNQQSLLRRLLSW